MKLGRLWITLSLCTVLSWGYAQDIHFTLHEMSPLWLNPARTGAFEGTARIGGLYRAQWFSLDGINTPSVYIDAPVIRGFRPQDWVGAGLLFIQDNARLELPAGSMTEGGSRFLKLKTGWQGLSVSYHLALDKDRTNVLTLGGQYTNTGVNLESGSGLVTEETIKAALGGLGLNMASDDLISGDQQVDYTDIAGGLMLRSKLSDDNLLEVGFAVQHIGTPRNGLGSGGFGSGGTNERPRTFHVHGSLDYKLNDDWTLMPRVFYQSAASNSTASIQAWAGRRVNEDVQLRFGLGYRSSDAAKVLFGLDYKDLRAALSYDLTLSQARQINNYQGSVELAAYYIIKVYKKPEVVPVILCPQI